MPSYDNIDLTSLVGHWKAVLQKKRGAQLVTWSSLGAMGYASESGVAVVPTRASS